MQISRRKFSCNDATVGPNRRHSNSGDARNYEYRSIAIKSDPRCCPTLCFPLRYSSCEKGDLIGSKIVFFTVSRDRACCGQKRFAQSDLLRGWIESWLPARELNQRNECSPGVRGRRALSSLSGDLLSGKERRRCQLQGESVTTIRNFPLDVA